MNNDSIRISEKGKPSSNAAIHKPILSAIKFTDSKAYEAAIKRAMSLGLTEAEAKQVVV